ncbi:chitinase class I-domain-containing protein [Scenedesmus sp. NREL 46B-D3]|nr:chitinase class I-domain-containing protein [Scenedesmus sp. NREL 46B-D3]
MKRGVTGSKGSQPPCTSHWLASARQSAPPIGTTQTQETFALALRGVMGLARAPIFPVRRACCSMTKSNACSSGYTQPGGACGSSSGLCCPSGCCSKYGCCGIADAHCGSGCQAGSPPSNGNPTAAGAVTEYISDRLFEQIFLHRNDAACTSNGFYTYNAFVAAAAAFRGFGTADDAVTNKRELAAFLAQISHEATGGWAAAPDGPYSWGLCWIREGLKTPVEQMPSYCADSAQYPCAPGTGTAIEACWVC